MQSWRDWGAPLLPPSSSRALGVIPVPGGLEADAAQSPRKGLAPAPQACYGGNQGSRGAGRQQGVSSRSVASNGEAP